MHQTTLNTVNYLVAPHAQPKKPQIGRPQDTDPRRPWCMACRRPMQRNGTTAYETERRYRCPGCGYEVRRAAQ